MVPPDLVIGEAAFAVVPVYRVRVMNIRLQLLPTSWVRWEAGVGTWSQTKNLFTFEDHCLHDLFSECPPTVGAEEVCLLRIQCAQREWSRVHVTVAPHPPSGFDLVGAARIAQR